MTQRLLILGGTREAADLAAAAVERFAERLDVVTSLAGRLAPSQILPGRLRVGGFGGAAALADYLGAERIDAVIDATHPFAKTMSGQAAAACETAGVPRLALVRPPWRQRPGDDWRLVHGAAQAAAILPAIARRVFLTTGPGSVGAFAGLERIWFLVRRFEPANGPLPLAGYEIVVARPPFSEAGERALMERHRIDTLVTKQSGGATEAKLAAARELGIPVVMIERPPPPPGPFVATVEDAIAWLEASGLARA